MLKLGLSPRSIVNRAYYSVFYFILALFQKHGLNVRTSKHSGVIGAFDREYVLPGRVERRLGKIVHTLFDARQEFDYKEFVEITVDDATGAVVDAQEFAAAIRLLLKSSLEL